MKLNKLLASFFVVVTVINTACTMPVCCAPGPVLSQQTETEKRLAVIDLSLELYSQRKFDQLAVLYANETRDLFEEAMKKQSAQMSDEKIANYVETMRNFEFAKEGRIDQDDYWHVAFEHKTDKASYVVYTLVKEEGVYRIVELNIIKA